jgi:hypothetical protein
MFGDGSLLDALPGAPPSGEEGATEPLVPAVEDLADLPMLPMLADGAATDGPAEQAAPPAPAQSLDTIIDSFPADPLSQSEAPAPSELSPESARLASRFTLIDRDAGQPDPAAVPVPPTFPERFQVSAIFAGLGTP